MEITEYKPLLDYDAIRAPSVEFEIEEWYYCGDLRRAFDQRSNLEVRYLLDSADVFRDLEVELDPETACFWVFFKSENAARRFVDRLNAFHRLYRSIWIREA